VRQLRTETGSQGVRPTSSGLLTSGSNTKPDPGACQVTRSAGSKSLDQREAAD
jgi:hypothetical protein